MNQQQLFTDIEFHLMHDDKPADFLKKICDTPDFQKYPFQLLYCLKGTVQSPKYHPEGDAWNHTLLVVNEAAKVKGESSDPKAFMWAALLHDIGKPDTTKIKKGRITSYDHDRMGAELSKKFLDEFALEPSFKQTVVNLVRYHMHILYVTKDLPFGDIKGLKKQANINDVALLGWCDRMGRTNADPLLEKETIEKFKSLLS